MSNPWEYVCFYESLASIIDLFDKRTKDDKRQIDARQTKIGNLEKRTEKLQKTIERMTEYIKKVEETDETEDFLRKYKKIVAEVSLTVTCRMQNLIG